MLIVSCFSGLQEAALLSSAALQVAPVNGSLFTPVLMISGAILALAEVWRPNFVDVHFLAMGSVCARIATRPSGLAVAGPHPLPAHLNLCVHRLKERFLRLVTAFWRRTRFSAPHRLSSFRADLTLHATPSSARRAPQTLGVGFDLLLERYNLKDRLSLHSCLFGRERCWFAQLCARGIARIATPPGILQAVQSPHCGTISVHVRTN